MRLIRWAWQGDNSPSIRIECEATGQSFVVKRYADRHFMTYTRNEDGPVGNGGNIKNLMRVVRGRIGTASLMKLSGVSHD